jgi:predicted Fe-Mo cluster-binding NifX family protein
MLACAVTDGGLVDPRWRCTERTATAKVEGDSTVRWEEFAVSWDTLRHSGSESVHQAWVVRFLRQHGLDAMVARHVGQDTRHMFRSVLEALA